MGSQNSYYNKFVLFLMYCIKFKLNIHRLNVDNVIAFIEILAGSNYSCTTIGTYVSAIKAKCTEFDLPIEP